ncbi:type VII secretion protein EssA [Bacillus sp. S10(2024)]|uniref:type VII secretion protein EssA n=1 Tax=Bacillus sp. S10(2024) TaxID=3162886 RepID=UPI003D1E53F0
MIKPKFFVFFLLISFCVTNLFPSFNRLAYAEDGRLTIHNNVIYEKESDKNKNSVTGIEDLFLKDKNTKNKELEKENIKSISSIKETVFLNDNPVEKKPQDTITKKLFSKDYKASNENEATVEHANYELPRWTFLILLIIGVTGMLILGWLLGKRFSNLFIRKKE